jgi:hypothetical protein
MQAGRAEQNSDDSASQQGRLFWSRPARGMRSPPLSPAAEQAGDTLITLHAHRCKAAVFYMST